MEHAAERAAALAPASEAPAVQDPKPEPDPAPPPADAKEPAPPTPAEPLPPQEPGPARPAADLLHREVCPVVEIFCFYDGRRRTLLLARRVRPGLTSLLNFWWKRNKPQRPR